MLAFALKDKPAISCRQTTIFWLMHEIACRFFLLLAFLMLILVSIPRRLEMSCFYDAAVQTGQRCHGTCLMMPFCCVAAEQMRMEMPWTRRVKKPNAMQHPAGDTYLPRRGSF
jgi:hypothetical protein